MPFVANAFIASRQPHVAGFARFLTAIDKERTECSRAARQNMPKCRSNPGTGSWPSIDGTVKNVDDVARQTATSTRRGVRNTAYLKMGCIVAYAAATFDLMFFWSTHQPVDDVGTSATCSTAVVHRRAGLHRRVSSGDMHADVPSMRHRYKKTA